MKNPFQRSGLRPGPPPPAFQGKIVQRKPAGVAVQRSFLSSLFGAKSDPKPLVTPRETVRDRHVTNPRFGVGETINLAMAGTPATGKSFKWKVSIGTLTVDGMQPTKAQYTVPDVDRTGTKFKLSIVEGTGMLPSGWTEVWSKEYEIVRPSDGCVYVEINKNFAHIKDTPSGGFILDCYLLDKDVSFMNVEIKEKGGLFHADGALHYMTMVTHPHSLNWYPGQRRDDTKGTYFVQDQSGRIIEPAKIDAKKYPNEHNNQWLGGDQKIGTAYRDIEWWYRMVGANDAGRLIQVVRLESTVYANGKLYHRKGTASRIINLGDVTDP